MRSVGFLGIVAVVMVLMDLYVFQVVKLLSEGLSPKARMVINVIYWSISILVVLVLLISPLVNFHALPHSFRNYLFATIAGIFFAKLIASLVFLVDDLRRAIQWTATKFFSRNATATGTDGEGISRSVFLSWLGIALGGGLFGTLVYGFGNKYKYQLTRVPMHFDTLPSAFRGLKIIHISDVHSGSFTDKKAVEHGIDMILAAKPDLILFTGDLVNDRASEMEPYQQMFSRLRAPLGVFSTLGNHDYGDYVVWNSEHEKIKNLETLKTIQADMGWRLLMNEHVVLEKGGQQIALIGIENWSAKMRFPKHGRLNLAHAGAEKYPFKILMSHDPSHWDAEVRPNYADIDLALAGHTHGMQFGIDIPGFKWSPVKYMYKEWAGLYQEGKQKLYVNRGYGFIGYPGRVGILPEITLIELV